MCFIFRRKDYSYKIAEYDIPIFKLLTSELISPWQNFPYELNKLYKEPIVIEFDDYDGTPYIEQGLHCYINYIDAKRQVIDLACYKLKSMILVQGYIPKGTIYYSKGFRGECCTNAYILEKVIGEASEKGNFFWRGCV